MASVARRLSWLCPPLMLAAAAASLLAWGFGVWAAAVAALLLACPVYLLWGTYLAHRASRGLAEPAPTTRSVLMDGMAPLYDALCRLVGLGPAFRHRTLSYAALRPGERVLDVGCGTGVLTRLAADVVGPQGEVVGIDPGPAMIVEARRNARAAGNRAQFRLAAIERLPFADRHFDVTLSSFMLHHLPPEVKAQGLREVYRVLKPGGRIVAVDVDRPANRLWWLALWPARWLPTVIPNLRGEIPAYLRAAGFEAVRVMGRSRGLVTFWGARRLERV